ncbi:hypothetical protein [Rhodococcus sp. ARC_M6]|uniref:hypothetical protein n=1 Tax=Rhodococcus sp. ARC_M6 TaxID=2928852 RepID=UPI001FB51113|nr:hypothetical protein [Rhodococcus sp. ARC_M6]MCJ0902522.1 hypothetical protein [Rhodococcus sp. ARC_M6]
MNSPHDPTTVLEFLQGSAVGPMLDTPAGTAVLGAVEHSALAPVLGMQIPGAVDLPSIPDFLVAPAKPQFPPNAAESLMQGIALPSLPGVDALFKPLIDLAKSLGSGVFNGTNPVNVLNQASALIEKAGGLSKSGLADVSQTWNGTGNEVATDTNEAAYRSGSELSERGTAISTTTAAAAESVQRGNAQLAAIAQSFATAVVAAAPIAWTPPGQALLLAAASEHMQAAIAAVNQTRGEMLAHTTVMNSLAGSIPVPPPPVSDALAALSPIAQTAAQQLTQVVEQAGSGTISAATQGQTQAGGSTPDSQLQSTSARTTAANASASPLAGVDKLWGTGNPLSPPAAPTSSHVANAVGSGGSVTGASAGGGTFGASTGSRVGGISGAAALSGPTSGSTSVASPAVGSPAGSMPGTSPAGGGMMGGGARGAGARGQQDDESSRTTPGYLIDVSDNNAIIGELPMVTPAVIGTEDPEGALFSGI